MSSTILKGDALTAIARQLNIPGRSRMSADQLRAAIDGMRGSMPEDTARRIAFLTLDPSWAPASPQVPASPQGGTLQVKIIPVNPGTPFRARNGKHKPSIRTNRRRSR